MIFSFSCHIRVNEESEELGRKRATDILIKEIKDGIIDTNKDFDQIVKDCFIIEKVE